MKDLQIGIVGTGFIGMQHVEAIRRIPRTKIIAVCEYTEERAKAVAELLGIENYYVSVEKMLENHPELDVVHNCTPSNMHHEINIKILNAGVNLYCEKPFTLYSHESKEVVTLAKEKGLKGAVNFNYRHNVMVEEMKERISNNLIGKPHFVQAQYLQDWLLKATDFDWRVEKLYGGESRAIADIGSHCLDTIQYIMGEKITSVYCKRRIIHPERTVVRNGKKITVKIENEDSAVMNLQFESGLAAVVRVSQITAGKKNDFNILVEGGEKTLEWYQEQPDRLWIGNRDVGNQEIYADTNYLTGKAKEKISLPNGHAVGWADAFKNAINSFYADIRQDENAHKDYTKLEDAHYIMKIIDACIESDRTSQWVNV